MRHAALLVAIDERPAILIDQPPVAVADGDHTVVVGHPHPTPDLVRRNGSDLPPEPQLFAGQLLVGRFGPQEPPATDRRGCHGDEQGAEAELVEIPQPAVAVRSRGGSNSFGRSR
jgi:hypothetical protein